jgi:uncharacterized membrane protein
MPRTVAELEKVIEGLKDELATLREALAATQREHEVEIKVLKEQVATQKAGGEKWEGRAWIFVSALVVSLFGAFLSLLGGSIALAIAVLKK